MKQKDRFRYAEKCLYEYNQNLACLEILREDLKEERAGLDVQAQKYDSHPEHNGLPSNPVQARYIRIEQLEGRIKLLERWTKPVTLMIEHLRNKDVMEESNKEVLMEILRLMYFGQNALPNLVSKLRMSYRTLARRRQELVKMAIEYLCL